MKICSHAVRRYKQRVGGKTSSRDKITRQIRSEINNYTRRSYIQNNHLYIQTRKFTAVVYKGTVITILPLEYREQQADIG